MIDVEPQTPPATKPTDAVAKFVAATGNDSASEDWLWRALVIVISQWRRLALRTIVGVVIAAVVLLLTPNRYTAVSVIMPPAQPQSLSSALLSSVPALGSLTGSSSSFSSKGQAETYVAMLKSRTIADGLVARFDLMKIYRDRYLSDARRDLAQNSLIEATKNGMISISVQDHDPKLAADIANAYVDQLTKLTGTIAVTEASQRRLFFEQQLLAVKEQLSNSEAAMQQTQEKSGVIQLDAQAKVAIQAAANIRAQIAATEVRLHSMRSFAAEQNPEYIAAKQQLEALRAQLSSMERQGSGSDSDASTRGMSKAGVEYIRRYREVRYNEMIYDQLAKQLEIAKIDEARQGSIVQTIDRAVVPDKKSWPMRSALLLTFSVVILLINIAVALIVYQWRQFTLDSGHRMRLSYFRRLIFNVESKS